MRRIGRLAGAGRVFGRAGVAALAGVLLLAGCSAGDPERHGAGEKLTASDERDDADRTAPERGPGLVGQRLPDLELSWLRPPAPGGSGESIGSDGAGGRGGARPDAEAGDPVALRDLTGEPLVINIWAAWCTPCRDEIPHFQRLWRQSGDQVRVLGVDHDDSADAAGELLTELEVDYPQLADPDAELKAPFGLGIGIPVTVYVRADGGIAHVARTPYRSLDQLRGDVERYLDVSL